MSYRLKRFIRGFRMGLLRVIFYEHNLEVVTKIESKIPVEIKILDNSNIFDITQVKKYSTNTLKKRLDNGDKCFVTEKSGRLLSFHWLQTKGKHNVQPIGKWEEIADGEAVIYDVRVHKDFRGNRINGLVYSEILQYCKNHSINRVWIYTDKKNVANRKGLENLSFRIYRQTLSLRFNNRYNLLSSKEF